MTPTELQERALSDTDNQQPLGRGLPSDGLLSLEEARRRITRAVDPIDGHESIRLDDCLGRILATEIRSPISVPPHANSALDGFAFSGGSIPENGRRVLDVIGTAWAGKPLDGTVGTGQAARIMTGAPMPAGTDSVLAQELVEWDDQHLYLKSDTKGGQNVRQAGEDLMAGEIALTSGKRIMPAELGLLASLGLTDIDVVRKLKVSIFSTGDELYRPGEPVGPGGIYDSNGFTLSGLLSRLGAVVDDGGIIRDERSAVQDALFSAADSADVIITSGGVSTGEADYVEEVLQSHGELGFWRVAIRPGRPLAFGHLGKAVFFGLPGNPVAVMVTFYQFLRNALSKMMGEADTPMLPCFKVRCDTPLRKRRGRTEFYRGILETSADGSLQVRRTPHQGSGVLRSMNEANCFIILPDDYASTEAGELVDVQPFHGLV